MLAATAALCRHVMAENAQTAELEKRLANDPMRPQYHLLPARNWMNDPNGPVYFKGRYHMFFQYNPQAAVWGDMSWGHAISKDMLHWTHLPVALTPTPGAPDAYGCFSGSAIVEGERVYVVYTGTKKSGDDLATIRDGANNIQESQCLAWSDDPRLVRWKKDPQPIVPRPPKGMEIAGFRDPSVWRHDDRYYMTVGSGVENEGGCVLLYRNSAGPLSADLRSWEYLHKLASGEWNRKKTANPCDDGEMWECPDFFALGDAADGGHHVLIYSTLGKVYWESGRLDETAMRFVPVKKGELDWGGFYAPKTQTDAQGRRILWGWIQEKDRSDEQMRTAGWSGMMSLPRVLSMDADGTLKIRLLPQSSSLRAGALESIRADGKTSVTLPQANGEMICMGETGKDFDLTVSHGASELMKVSYSSKDHAFLADGKKIALGPEDAPRLHAFVDASVIEMIVGERVGYTKRFYFEGPAPSIVAQATGPGHVSIDAWKVAPISKNRLTTPA
jgi:beta-fructofuranosidase